ncbi:MAG: acetylornithine deacetylase [Pseudomonadota bacterium]
MDIAAQISWIERLIQFDTTSHLSNLTMIEDIEAYLAGHGVRSFRAPDDTGEKTNLYAVIGPDVAGGVVLSGHSDVVPVTDQAWDTDPFTLIQKDGALFGRGTADMKSFPAITLSLLPEIVAADLKRPIILALSYDEEIGCIGAPRMIERIARDLPTPSAVIVGEPTSMRVVDGHKGISSFRTHITGYTTHSSQVERGVSAVEAAAKLITFLSACRLDNQANADRSVPFDPPYSTLTVNVMHGGTQLNIMAGEAWFEWDMRLLPGDKQEMFRARFEEHARTVEAQMQAIAPGCAITTEQLTNAPPLAPRADNPAADLAKALTGHNHTEVVAFAAEAGQFQEAGFSTVICGPGSIDQAHQPNEFITLDQVAVGTKFQRKLINHLAA